MILEAQVKTNSLFFRGKVKKITSNFIFSEVLTSYNNLIIK